MVILVGHISYDQFSKAEVKVVSHIRDTKYLDDGDVVNFLGHGLVYDKETCVSDETCRHWRTLSDPVCDDVLLEIFPTTSMSTGKDLLRSVECYANDNAPSSAAAAFLKAVSEPPPSDIQASEEDIAIAQLFFIDHSIQIMQALLYYSLAGGFASPRIMRTLNAVSYLVPSRPQTQNSSPLADKASSDRTFSRLLETFQFVLDILGCTAAPLQRPDHNQLDSKTTSRLDYLLPGGEGWKSVVRVRLLHGVARRRAKERLSKLYPEYDFALHVPINQEDMGATLAAFAVVPLWALKRLGLEPSPAESRSYLALWRHVGFYLGVSPDILRRFFVLPKTSDLFLASVALSLFSEDPDDTLTPAGDTPSATMSILSAISDRGRLSNNVSNTSLAYNCTVTRFLVGDVLADRLGLPLSSTLNLGKLRFWTFMHKIPVWFGHWYPRQAWLEKRRTVFREGLVRSVRWRLGQRQASFRPRTDTFTSDDTHDGGELADGVKEAESVPRDLAGARHIVRLWRELLFEMIAVLACIVLLVALSFIPLFVSIWGATQQ